jgi:electron transfer flavoprotein alpha subunit
VYEFGPRNPQIAVLRPGVFEPAQPAPGAEGQVVAFDVGDAIAEPAARLVEAVPEERAGVRLENAQVVVAGGRGMGGPAAFEQLQALASLLNGAVGATRAACDAGWVDHTCQIGLTGRTVAPGLYIAVGISGASQHMAGCAGAKIIVAINRDPNASIFRGARYGVVGEWERVLPAFAAALREREGSRCPDGDPRRG